jgi:sugar phosphate isomerase/epimerase
MTVLFCTSAFPKAPLQRVAELAHRCGYDGLDISADLFERGPAPHIDPRAPESELRVIPARLGALAPSASALSANIYLVAEDAARVQFAKGHVKAVIDLAGSIGIPFVHVFSGRAPVALSLAAAKRQFANTLTELVEYAAARKVTIGIEGCAVHFVRSMAEHLELFDMMPGINLRLCFDPSHLFLHGEPVLDATERLFDRISLVHVKDAAGRLPTFKLPPLGEGEMPWTELLALLGRRGYSGGYAVEYEAAQFGWAEDELMVLTHGRDFLRRHGI